MKVELTDDIVLFLPSEDEGAIEEIGVENWRKIAKYGGRAVAKLRKYLQDGHVSLVETIGLVKLTIKGVRMGRAVDFSALKAERLNMSPQERNSLVHEFKDSFDRASNEKELSYEEANSLLEDFLQSEEANARLLGDRVAA